MAWREFGGSLAESTENALCSVLEGMSSSSFVKTNLLFLYVCKVK